MAFESGTGGTGTYAVAPSQTVASETMQANGTGARSSDYTTFTNVRPVLAMLDSNFVTFLTLVDSCGS